MTELMEIPLSLIHSSSFQMRNFMDPEALEALTVSVRRDGQQRPVKVRPHPSRPGEYELVFGHRTVSALKRAGLEAAQAVVEELSDEEVMLAQHAENMYREDITDYDMALWFKTMIDEFGYTQKQLAELEGKSRPVIANHLRMLQLDGNVSRETLYRMTEGQARAILAAPRKLLPEVCSRIEQFLRDNDGLPSTSSIADIITYTKAMHRLEEVKARTVPDGMPGSPIESGQVGIDGASSEKSDYTEGSAATENLDGEPSTADSPDVELPDTPEEYIASYFQRHPYADEEDEKFLAWDIARKYDIPQAESKQLVEAHLEQKLKTRRPPVQRITRYESEKPTIRCPLCGRQGADRNLILTHVEDPSIAQKTLEQFITERVRR